MEDNPNSVLEKEFAKQELIYIVILTIILLGAWALSSNIFGSVLEMLNRNQYCYGIIATTVVITVGVMRVFGKHFVHFISKFWMKK